MFTLYHVEKGDHFPKTTLSSFHTKVKHFSSQCSLNVFKLHIK